jgi:hypothetical protein
MRSNLCLSISFCIEIHAAAKETVALAEQRFMSNSHEWQFDNAWQEMLNNSTLKVRSMHKFLKKYIFINAQ